MKKPMKRYLFGLFLLQCTLTVSVYGQQRPQFTQYMINPFVMNPAVSGTEDYTDLRAGYRMQWVGFEGAPRTFYLSAHTNIGKNRVVNNRTKHKKNGFHGIGGMVLKDVTGASSFTSVTLAYSYHLALTKKIFASMGLSGGIQQYLLDGNMLHTANPGDPVIGSISNRSLADINAGFWVYSDNFYVGGSLVEVARQRLYNFSTSYQTLGGTAHHYFLTGGYRFPMGYDFTFIPSFLLKAVNPSPLSVDLNAKLRYKDFAWAGVSYRHKDAVAILAGLIISNSFDISYSFDLTTSKIARYNSGTHEIVIGYRIKPKGKVYCPGAFW